MLLDYKGKTRENMREYSDVVIIGAGASGLLCGGILASSGFLVTILEKNDRVGKKLSATGNGRCNFTNQNMSAGQFYGDNQWVERVLDGYGPDEIIKQLEEIGIYHREKDGYVYPYTNQAAVVVEILERYCIDNRADIVLGCKATSIINMKEKDQYRIRTPEGEIRCRYVILAAGGKASKELGGDGSGYILAKSLGHRMQSVFPGLTGLICRGRFWKQVAGTRVQGRFSLIIDNQVTEGECGEIQITKDGVSGIPVFQLCRVAAQAIAEGRVVEGQIDFVPAMTEEELVQWIKKFGISGLVQKKWCTYFQSRAEIVRNLKAFRFPVESTFGMERAQVTAGGILTEEVCPETLESLFNPHLFLLGEILDVDGKCGGYNLHLAFTCACRAAAEIKKKEQGE